MLTEKQDKALKEALDILITKETDKSKILGQGGLLKELTKRLVEKALSTEMEEHLGYAKHERSESANSRNGTSSKELHTESGSISLDVPRDRDATFEPQFVGKRKTRIEGLDDKILSLYAKGMSVSNIQIQLHELYGTEISESLISRITHEVMEDVRAWQNRPLDKVYPIVLFDCLVVKVREEGRIINKAIYIALGINSEGIKEVLGLWISKNEGAKFWLGVFTELKNRGLEDILIACTDNLTGMNESISAVYPKTEHQLCIVHQIRNSIKYVPHKHKKAVCRDLKQIYTAVSETQAQQELESFASKWDAFYPQISKSWKSNWDNLVIFLDYPEAIRRIIYTTNSIESLNSQLRQVTKNKRVFPNDDAVFKSLYLKIKNASAKWTVQIRNWNEAMAHFLIRFEGRL